MSVRFNTVDSSAHNKNRAALPHASHTTVGFSAAAGKHQQPPLHMSHISSSGTDDFFTHDNNNNNAAPHDDAAELSLSRFSLPTLSSRRQKQASSDVAIPPELQELQKLTPRQRIQKEFQLRHRAMHHQRPTSLFGAEYDKAAERREQLEERSGFVSQQAAERKKREETFMSMRLSRSGLAMSQSLAVEKGLEEKVPDPKLSRPSPWVNNSAGADRHKFQINWPDPGAPLPTIPDRWSGPGPGAYGGSISFFKPQTPRGL